MASSRTPRTATTSSASKPAAGRVTRGTAAPATRPRLPKAVTAALDAALEKKALDVVVLDLRKAGGFTDYFVICTGANPRQVTAIADSVREALKQAGERPAVMEGTDHSAWVLLDYFNFVVHVFSRECRAFYDLERLWGNAVRHAIPASEPPAT
jgi:ribosome-associated protein